MPHNRTSAGHDRQASALEPYGTGTEIVPDVLRGHDDLSSKSFGTGRCALRPGEHVILDFGRKRTGWIRMAGKGRVSFALASDLKILELYDGPLGRRDDFQGDQLPSYCSGQGRGTMALAQAATLLHPQSNALRYIRLVNETDTTVEVHHISLAPSEFPKRPAGSFQCSSKLLNSGFQYGIDTLHLCTQPGEESLAPVFAPFGDGYVQWDGCRRDREIWGGDLRPSALAWYYNFEDQSPIANSLYVIMNAQHCSCNEHGVFPGSGSTHQLIYEWAFWEMVCLWEYILHTGDEKLLRFAAHTVPQFLGWCERKFSEHDDGWIRSTFCWMYTVKFEQQVLPGLQAAAIMGLKAMKSLFRYLQMSDHVGRTGKLIEQIVRRFHQAFWSQEIGAYTFLTRDTHDGSSCSDLATNCWAILADIVKPSERMPLLDTLQRRHWTEAGSINIAPVLEQASLHNDCVWPYANSYEVVARFYSGDIDGALELFKRYIRRISSIGHNTLFEMINIDGSLPIDPATGNTLSFCHCWASQGSWALQRYLLGIAPAEVGWRTFHFAPVDAPLEWLQGSVVTPRGAIDVEIDNSNGVQKGKVIYPKALQCVQSDDCKARRSIEFISK